MLYWCGRQILLICKETNTYNDWNTITFNYNKANLWDLIAATGLVFLLEIGFKSLIFGPMWPGNLMEYLKSNRAPPLYYANLCASFQSHLWIQTGVTVRKRSIWVITGDFIFPCDLKIWWMTLKNKLQSRNTKFWSKSANFCPVWPWNLTLTLKNNRAPLLYHSCHW